MGEMALKRRTKWAIALAVVLVAGAGGTYLFLERNDQPQAAAQSAISTVKVQKGNIRLSVSGTSQFATQNLQNITAPADGTIRTLNLTRSQPVKQGDVLVVVSNPTLESALKDAAATYETLEKELDELIRQQQNLRITAPADGKLSLTNLDVGTSISKNARMGTVSVNATLITKLPFAAEEAVQFQVGDPVDLAVAGFTLTKTGRVQSVGKELKADGFGNRIVQVEVALDNDGAVDYGTEVSGSVLLGGRSVASKGTAVLEPLRTVAFLSETSGIVTEMRKRNGDQVKAGEIIAVVVNDSLQDSITAKRTSLERQKNTLEQAQKRVDDLTVLAPFDGVFSTDFANQRQNVLARFPIGSQIEQGALFGGVASLDVMTLPIQVDELDLSSIKPGLRAEVTVDAIAGRRFEGEVLQVSTVGTTTSGVTYYDAVVAVPNKDQALKYGMTGTAEILIQDKRDVLTLPIEVLRIQRGGAAVSVKKPDGSVEENVAVEIGVRSKTHVEIVSGLQEGDEVVSQSRRASGSGTQQQIDALRRQFQQTGGGGGGVMQGGSFPAGGGFPGGGGGGR